MLAKLILYSLLTQFNLHPPELPFLAAYYYCFSFPIEYYPITKGKYRITKSLWDKDREIKLNAMFEIN